MLVTTPRIRSIKLRLAVNAYLATMLIMIMTMFIYSHYFEKDFDIRFQNRVVSVARTAALLINADDFDLLRTKDDESSENYHHIRKIIQDIKRANPQILFIYTMRPSNEKNIYEFVVDADKKPYHIGEKYDISGQEVIKKALKYPVAETEYENNRWGKYLTGYAPIMDSVGKTVGIVGVDFAVKSPDEPEKHYFGTASMIVLVLALALITYFTLRKIRIIKPLTQIIEGVHTISQGNFNHKVNVRSNDEFQDLANSLNHLSESMDQMQKRMLKELKSTEENSRKVLSVYSDVIYSVTQGRIRLMETDEAQPLALEGVLYSEASLEKQDDIDNVSSLTQQLFVEKDFGLQKTANALICVREAAANAVKHAGRGSVQLRILDGYIRIIIIDHGSGMDFNRLPTILFLRGSSEDLSAKCGFPAILECADRIFLATSEDGTIIAIDFELKKK